MKLNLREKMESMGHKTRKLDRPGYKMYTCINCGLTCATDERRADLGRGLYMGPLSAGRIEFTNDNIPECNEYAMRQALE